MNDNALINLLATAMETASTNSGWKYNNSRYQVVQKEEPTAQATPLGPTIFFQKLFDRPFGWAITQDVYDATNHVFDESETQLWETTFQISALAIQDPTNLALPTASDVVNYQKLFLCSRFNIASFQSQGVGVIRVTEVRNPYFQDDMDRSEATPNFDLTLTYSRSITNVIPKIQQVVPSVTAGVELTGTFPV